MSASLKNRSGCSLNTIPIYAMFLITRNYTTYAEGSVLNKVARSTYVIV